MIIFDMSNVFFSSVHEYNARTNEPLDEDTFRAMILRRINSMIRTLKVGKNRKVVFAFDSRNYWRREHFPYYKSQRKVEREKSTVDWDTIFGYWNKVVEEFKTYLPYYCIMVDGAEADDIQAALCFRHADEEDEIILVTSDEDSIQLQRTYSNVKQYSLKHKKMIDAKAVNYDLFEHIVRGDRGDGIPNIISPNDTLYNGIRQKRLLSTKVEEWKFHGIRNPEGFCDDEMLERFKLNKLMVDYDEIPMDLIEKIDQVFLNYKVPKGRLFSYLVKYQLTGLMEDY